MHCGGAVYVAMCDLMHCWVAISGVVYLDVSLVSAVMYR